MDMTRDEIIKWVRTHKYVTTADSFTDSCGNVDELRIYTDGVKFFSVEFSNDEPCEKWAGNGFNQGYVRGDYAEPIEVVRKTRMVEETYYEKVDRC